MSGIEIARTQHAIGGAIGVALLLFALIYRFFPSLIHTPTPIQPQLDAVRLPTTVPLPPALIAQTTPANKALLTPSEQITLELMGPPETVASDAAPTKALVDLLKQAEQAQQAGKLLEPKNNNAYTLYQQVLSSDPTNAVAKAGVEQVKKSLAEQVRSALTRGDEKESLRLLTALENIAPDYSELDRLQARLKIVSQIAPLLAQAANLLKQGYAIEPADNNALDIYRQVLKLDPENPVADQGLAQIARTYLERALAAVAQDDFINADALLADAAKVRPGAQELLDTRTRIEGIRRQRAVSILDQARSAVDSGDAELAEQLAKRAIVMSTDVPGMDEFQQHLQNARLYASLHPGQVITDSFLDRGGNAPALVIVPTGKFLMGSPNAEIGHRSSEEPQREVKINLGFALGREEVTVGEFREFVKASGYITDAEKYGASSLYDENTGRMNDQRSVTWQDDYEGERAADNLPVVHISWNDAMAYIEWLHARTGKQYRLPSEAEFEYALRAGSQHRYWWGEGNPASVLANITGDGDHSPSRRSWTKAFPRYHDGFWGPAPVRSFPSNPFGLYDIDGNVSEWVEDCWHDNYVRAPQDSRAWVNPGCTSHVIRGGCWGSAPDQVRSAYRVAAPTITRSARIGFRLARDL